MKKPNLVLLSYLMPFLETKELTVLEKKVNKTGVSKTVSSHLNRGFTLPESNPLMNSAPIT